jgi:hypothetical protein
VVWSLARWNMVAMTTPKAAQFARETVPCE